MAGLFWKVIVVLLGPMLVIGFVRMSLGADPSQFLPPYEVLFSKFSSMPDFTNDFNSAIETFNNAMARNINAWNNIDSLETFFSAFGSFFDMIGSAFMVAMQCLAIPFKFFYWVFTVIFDVTDVASSASAPIPVVV